VSGVVGGAHVADGFQTGQVAPLRVRRRGSGTGEAQGRNLLLLRSGITFALLASAVSVHFREPELILSGGFQYLYAAIVLSYGWLLVRYAFWGTRELPLPLLLGQALVDVAFVSLIVFATGLYDSVFAFMYIVIILLGSIEMFMKGAMLWAALSAGSYVALLYLQMKGVVVPPGGHDALPGLHEILRPSLTNSIGFLLTGVLSGMLGEDIRVTRIRVHEREDVLQQLETFHKYVVDNIPSGILTVDPHGRVSLINDTACAILAVDRGAVTGRSVTEVLGDVTLDASRADPRLPRPEIPFRRADGTEIFLGFSSSPIKDAEGSVIGSVVIFQDLTPVKQMEERVRIADRLAVVGEMAAGLAHEIRNPLASIAGSSQMLREMPEIPEMSRALLDIIGRESTRLNNLISNFLAYTGPSLRNVEVVDMAALVEEIVEAVRAGDGRQAGVDVRKTDSGSHQVEGDAELLRQVLWNLVRNAVHATAPGGRVLLDVFPQVRHHESYIVTSVSDTGSGIDPAILGKIFNPFFTSKEGGTGLGLAISQRIVQFHRGFIEVRSTPGRGSTFSIFLPRPGDRGASPGPSARPSCPPPE
jgi:two-component system, NtrC family, sensor histidine kinase PilS